jgi:2,3-bisphosphoglycerate-independent phosphoglycerate mutase
MNFKMIKHLLQPAETKIVLLVLGGLGGLPRGLGNITELETARTPYLDDLATRSLCGLQLPIAPAVTPGSGPAHLSLLGYDPLEFRIGRGVLSALGIGFNLDPEDVVASGNFCTVNSDGRVSDRRADRIDTQKNRELCETLGHIEIDETRLFIETVKEYRFMLALRGDNLSSDIEDTDPQTIGRQPLAPKARTPQAEKTAALVRRFLSAAHDRLASEHPANMILLRGFSQRPQWPTMMDVFGLRAATISSYPMYRGLGRLVGIKALETGESLSEEIQTLEDHWSDFDLFYLHVKKTDSAGKNGDFDRKVDLIEEVDGVIPRLLKLAPDVMIVTGDRSTPATLQSHSWHPVPVILHSRFCRPDPVSHFGESACIDGGLGPQFPAKNIMPLALANAGRLKKFGA